MRFYTYLALRGLARDAKPDPGKPMTCLQTAHAIASTIGMCLLLYVMVTQKREEKPSFITAYFNDMGCDLAWIGSWVGIPYPEKCSRNTTFTREFMDEVKGTGPYGTQLDLERLAEEAKRLGEESQRATAEYIKSVGVENLLYDLSSKEMEFTSYARPTSGRACGLTDHPRYVEGDTHTTFNPIDEAEGRERVA